MKFSIDHVQLAMPPDLEATAEEFYVGILGFVVLPKPEPLAARGGRWFEHGELQLHLGVDPKFVPSVKAHVALRVSGFEELQERLRASGARVELDYELSGVQRFYTWDPFGNRLEMIRDTAN